jgi:hypothetical protein
VEKVNMNEVDRAGDGENVMCVKCTEGVGAGPLPLFCLCK